MEKGKSKGKGEREDVGEKGEEGKGGIKGCHYSGVIVPFPTASSICETVNQEIRRWRGEY